MANNICIVDDEPAILNTLSSILEDEGYQISVAKSGHEALKLVRGEQPDVVLLDIWMPELDGLETLKRLRQAAPFTPGYYDVGPWVNRNGGESHEIRCV